MNNKKFSDVIFAVGGEKFYAHKILLAKKSPVFAALFDQQIIIQNINRVIYVDDTESEVFKVLLHYIYTDKNDYINNDIIAQKLFIVALKYKITELTDICEKKLCDSLSINNAVEILNFTDKYNAQLLKNAALDYFIFHAKDVVKIPSFKKIT